MRTKSESQIVSASVKIPTSGIYFLIDNNKIVYCGKTKKMYERIWSHIRDKGKKFDRYFFIPMSAKESDDAEKVYISKFQPKYNK